MVSTFISGFSSYFFHIQIKNSNPKRVLEVGVGNGFVTSYLKRLGYDVTTLDILKTYVPDMKASVLKMPFKDGYFDVCLCCEVLEHLPFEYFQAGLDELSRVSKQRVILSLPDSSYHFGLKVVMPSFSLSRLISLPKFMHKRHFFDGAHYWEIGKMGYDLSMVIKEIELCELKIINTYKIFENPYIRFFILKKNFGHS